MWSGHGSTGIISLSMNSVTKGEKGHQSGGEGGHSYGMSRKCFIIYFLSCDDFVYFKCIFQGGQVGRGQKRLRLCLPTSIRLGISHIPFFFIINTRTQDPAAQKEG